MCPVILLALVFSFLLLLLEVTAAVNVTFNYTVLKIKEEEIQPVYFVLSDKFSTNPNESSYRVISEDKSIASVINSSFSDGGNFTNYFFVRGNFLGKTFIRVEKTVNGTVKDTSQSLPVNVVRRIKTISNVFTSSVALLVSLSFINMGCALDMSVVKSVLKKPIAPSIGFLCQSVLMPLIAYCLARFMFSDVIFQLGLFTFGCSPGGGASNMWTAVLKGNLDLSLTMTFISNILAFGMMPLWLFTLGHSLFSKISPEIPYLRILYTLAGMLIPLAIGLSFQKFLPRVAKFLHRILVPFCICIIIFIIVFGTYANLYIFKLMTWEIIVASSVNVWLGFLFGSVISKAFDLPIDDIIAVAVETGVQNTGISIVLLRFSLEQPEADIASIVPIAASIMTPWPLFFAYIFIKIRSRYSVKVPESRLYVMDDEEERKTLPTPDSSDSMLVSKLM